MIAYRIADARHPIFDPTGAMLHGGRWNSVGQKVIYAAESYAGAMLEVLVHANFSTSPKHHRVVRISVPDSVQIETLEAASLPGWDGEDLTFTRAFGDRWLQEKRSTVLHVPSVVTGGIEHNVLFNPQHEHFLIVETAAAEAIKWDIRLFRQRSVGRARL